MKRYLFLIFSLILLSCSSPSENSFIVYLDTIYDQPNRGFLILYPMDEMEDSIRNQITFPDLSGISDMLFAKTYFTGNNYSALENNVLLLIGVYKSKSPSI